VDLADHLGHEAAAIASPLPTRQADPFAELRRVVERVQVGTLTVNVSTLKALLDNATLPPPSSATPAEGMVEAHRAVLESWLETCRKCPDHTDDMAYFGIDTRHGEVRKLAAALEAVLRSPATIRQEAMQHVAYFDEGQFHWMSGIKPRDCELYAQWPSAIRSAKSGETGNVG